MSPATLINAMGGLAPEVLADPIAVTVEVVVAVEPSLDRTVIADAVARVSGGRVKQRRLAQALLDRPGHAARWTVAGSPRRG